jgi:hypothetical protein
MTKLGNRNDTYTYYWQVLPTEWADGRPRIIPGLRGPSVPASPLVIHQRLDPKTRCRRLAGNSGGRLVGSLAAVTGISNRQVLSTFQPPLTTTAKVWVLQMAVIAYGQETDLKNGSKAIK